MRAKHLSQYLSAVLIWSCLVSLSSCARPARLLASSSGSLNVKAVNLGGWLVTEGWIEPSLFDDIVNKDLLVRSWFRHISGFVHSHFLYELSCSCLEQ
jgi:hypothetical protein